MKNPLVIGYKGEIGSFILQGLLKIMPKATNIWCFDINETSKERIDRIKKSDVIFLCVPLDETVDWLAKYQKYLKGKKVIEQSSLKSVLFDSKKLAVCYYELLSMHILFRPSATPDPKDRQIAFIGKEWNIISNCKLRILICKMLNSTETSYENYKEHDEDMAYQQALVHRNILLLDRFLPRTHTYMSKQIHRLAERIKAGDPKLYKMIQENPHAQKAFKKYINKLND